MKRFLLLVMLAAAAGSSLFAEEPKGCSLCLGIVADMTPLPGEAAIPLLVHGASDSLSALDPYFSSLPAGQRARTVLAIRVRVSSEDKLSELNGIVDQIVEIAQKNGPFAAVGITLLNEDAALQAYAIKRLAVNLQGRDLAASIAFAPSSVESLANLYENEGQAYFDEVIVSRELVPVIAKWLTERDPIKKIWAVVSPSNSNHFYDSASAFRDGATLVFLTVPNAEEEVKAVAGFNRELAGDFAFDASSQIELLDASGTKREGEVLSFVRGEDLRTILIPPGGATSPFIITVPGDQFSSPRRIDADGEQKVTDVGKRGDQYLIGVQQSARSFLFSVDRPPVESAGATREAIDITSKKVISVEEIIRNHQAYWTYQGTIRPRYIARNETKLRFGVAEAGESVEATISGPYFVEATGVADWLWSEFYLNGVKWRYGRIPELPLVQPEKVTQLPLDIHFTNDYRYRLVDEGKMRDFDVYEIRFEPPPKAAPGLPLYRGTVWIDRKTMARIRVTMVQMNLAGEVLSSEERVDFTPFDPTSGSLLTVEETYRRRSKDILWLPSTVAAQQVISAAGRSTVVLRETRFKNLELAPSTYDERHRAASSSNERMVRDTEHGLRYLERQDDGQRVVKEGTDTSRIFLLAGMHHDDGLEFPVVPLGGLDYFNFNLKNTGMQTNVFFAGVILTANLTDPSFMGTRANLGADFFALAIPFENSMYRGGTKVESETVKSLPISFSMRMGHPIFEFGKADLSITARHLSFQRAEATGADYFIPSDTVEFIPSLSARYDRWGYSLSTNYEYGSRSKWEPWGNLDEYSEEQKNFSRFRVALGKSFYLPRFQRVGLELDYLDGRNLDRFSKYELGFFGAQRIRGVQSGTVRAERALLGHLSYGFVLNDQFRLEAFYDHGLLDDQFSGYRREPFQGVGVGGQTIGPWGTVLRLDLGKTVGRNAQDGFVANVIFLKLFG